MIVVAFKILVINYLVVGLRVFARRCSSFRFIFAVLSFFGCAIGLVSGIATKAEMDSPKSLIIFW